MSQPSFTNYFTPTYHHNPYPAISPTQPTLSKAGRTVLVTAGGSGIGLHISTAFCQAKAANVILLSRRQAVLDAAASNLGKEFPDTKLHTYVADITDASAIASVFKDVTEKIGRVDILVNCAANHTRSRVPIAEVSASDVQETFNTLVHGPTNLLNAFIASSPLDPANEKIFINLASATAHYMFPSMHAYGSAKAAFSILLQHYDIELGGKGLRVHSIHPGAVLSEEAKKAGADTGMMVWDDGALCGGFVAWLSSPKGAFLRGRFVWANWDVEELEGRKAEIEANPDVLKLGLVTGKLELFPAGGKK